MKDNARIIVQIKFGSHLYGTSTPQSDLDIKGVYLPSERDILLQRIPPLMSYSRPKEHGEKNSSDDVDREFYSLDRYLELLAEGQTVALDMLFAPDWAMTTPPDTVWLEVKALAPRILTKGATAFVRYCRQQANKYGIKGSRVAAARAALELLKKAEAAHGAQEKLALVRPELERLSEENEFIKLPEGREANGMSITYFEVCGKKALLTGSIKLAREISQTLVDEYGQRALAAEKSEGVDWKALSHALRVGNEALELFSSGKITFPRPEADFLISVKQGKVPYPEVAERIENLLVEVETAAANSNLPETSDQSVIDGFVLDAYRKQISR